MWLNTDKIIGTIVRIVIKFAGYKSFETWKPGEKLKILLVGYNGKQNIGADVRVESMTQQFYNILGQDNIEIGAIIFDEKSVDAYFPPPIKQERISSIFILPLLEVCSRYHMIVLSEGGCLKSKFSNSLLLFFIEAAGIAKMQHKPCVAYGVEAGHMDKFMYKMVKTNCDDAHFIARTQPSLEIIKQMNLKGTLGTDTAWVFKAMNKEWMKKELKKNLDWDGDKPVIGICVINPYCWPVVANFKKFLTLDWRRNPKGHYSKWYFFSQSKKREKKFKLYLKNIANAINKFTKEKDVLVVIIGMEALDLDACKRLKNLLKAKTSIFCSNQYNGYQITSILKNLSLLITSRYHARVLSMPGGVPSIGVSMDERLSNLMDETNHMDYCIDIEDPDMYSKLDHALKTIWERRKQVSTKIINSMPNYLNLLSDMGDFFKNYVKEKFPEFAIVGIKPNKKTKEL